MLQTQNVGRGACAEQLMSKFQLLAVAESPSIASLHGSSQAFLTYCQFECGEKLTRYIVWPPNWDDRRTRAWTYDLNLMWDIGIGTSVRIESGRRFRPRTRRSINDVGSVVDLWEFATSVLARYLGRCLYQNWGSSCLSTWSNIQ